METLDKKDITKEEALGALQGEILESLKEVNDLLPELGHGEAKRLLMATLSYPLEVHDYSLEKDSMKLAYSATKRLKDAMIALGVEVTLENMVRKQVESNQAQENIENQTTLVPESGTTGENNA